MKASDYIASALKRQGVTCVFEMVGGMITHILDSLYTQGGIKVVSVHHEQAAAFAADAYGRMTGIPGVAMATSGPGATNLLTGIGSCYFDSSPAIFITGQVNRAEMKGDRAIRQLGFQETDIVSIAKPITKAAWSVQEPNELPSILDRAFELAVQGRPGPVLIDIPMDVQRCNIADTILDRQPCPTYRTNEAAQSTIRTLHEELDKAQKPLILIGGGIQASRTAQLFREFAEARKIPVVYSLMAVDALPYQHPLRVGLIGSYGNRWANLTLASADLLLVLGSRLDVRQTGADTQSFKANRLIYHVDCERGEINNRVVGCKSIVLELAVFFEMATQFFRKNSLPNRDVWWQEIEELRKKWPDREELKDINGVNPNELMHRISSSSQSAAAYVVDVGQHQMWAAQSIEIKSGQRFLTSGGMGSMGFALPAALGAAFAARGQPIVLIAGDGGFQCNIQELQTVVRNRLPLKMVILNNGCHGMVRQFQESYFDKRYQSTLWGYSAPDFAKIAEAYGIPSTTISSSADIDRALNVLWADVNSPSLLQVMIDTNANAYPKLAFGKPISEMEPFSKPLEMEGT